MNVNGSVSFLESIASNTEREASTRMQELRRAEQIRPIPAPIQRKPQQRSRADLLTIWKRQGQVFTEMTRQGATLIETERAMIAAALE